MRTMTSERRKNPKPFTPVKGEVYTNANGAKYLCEADGHQDEDGRSIAWMTNIKSGWSMTTKGIVMYDNGEIEWDYSTDGTFLPIVMYDNGEIEWDYSTDGTFLPIDDQRQAMIDAAIQREIDRKVTRAAMKAKQASILNALLCCLI